MINYDTARADFETLEEIAELTDQVELDSMRLELMQDPTPKKAAQMYCVGIRLWIAQHDLSTSTAVEIADRHGLI